MRNDPLGLSALKGGRELGDLISTNIGKDETLRSLLASGELCTSAEDFIFKTLEANYGELDEATKSELLDLPTTMLEVALLTRATSAAVYLLASLSQLAWARRSAREREVSAAVNMLGEELQDGER